MFGDYFVYTLMSLNVGAACAYLWQGAYGQALYWLAACLLNLCILMRLK